MDIDEIIVANKELLYKKTKEALEELIPDAATIYVTEYDGYYTYVPVDESNIEKAIFAFEKRKVSVISFMEQTRHNSYRNVVASTILDACPEIKELAMEVKVPKNSIRASVAKVIPNIRKYDYIYRNELRDYFDSSKMTSLLLQNPKYAPMVNVYLETVRQDAELQENMLKAIPDNYPDLYPKTRQMKRRFVLHVGPTNSGKTHDAIKALEDAGEGVYLAPLRLLAFEQYERINADGHPCELLTGEEEMPVEGAKITSSTIEMLDINRRCRVAVIDEAQMVSDRDRGGAWTAAILGVMADEVHVCLAPEAEDLIIKMVKSCGDDIEIVRHERAVPLVKSEEKVSFPDGIREKDAFIAFSRKSVIRIAGELQRMGKSVSVIYGALPYSVRHREAERFANGETDYLVATDAVGMGMNLPIRRVVLMEGRKYDGEQFRQLTHSEILQIIGRAGRKGMYDEGYWATDGFDSMVQSAVKAPPPKRSTACIDFPKTLIYLDAPLSSIIQKWTDIKAVDGYRQTKTDVLLSLCKRAEAMTADKDLIYSLITIPFDIEKPELMSIWYSYANHVTGRPDEPRYYTLEQIQNKIRGMNSPDDIEKLEALFKSEDLIFQCVKRFDYDKDKLEKTMKCKDLISEQINTILATQKFGRRKCPKCGRELKWNFPYPMCDKCHEKEMMYRYLYNDY